MTRTLATLTSFFLLLASAAGAEEMTGKVKVANNAADTLTLEDGTLFYLSDTASMKGLKPGMTVVVTYEVQSDVKVAVKIAEKK